MRRIALVLLALWAGSCAPLPAPDRPRGPDPASQPAAPWLAGFLHELYRTQPFVSHPAGESDPGWLALPVSFAAVDRLRQGIERAEGAVLEHRGEAHITVVTPPEARAIRNHDPAYTLEVLEALARPALDSARWSTPGIGRVEGDGRRTWFLVVESPDLLAIREALARDLGLPRSVFDPRAQDLHVTIGFVGGDLWPPAGSKGRLSLKPELAWDRVLDHP